MRVFLTGATGFLGSAIAERCRRAGDQVVAAVRASSRTDWLATLGAELWVAALDDEAALAAGMQGADVVVHAAARVHTHGCWREFAATTIAGTRQVLGAAAAAGVPRFIQISSVGVYGYPRADGRPFQETDGLGQPDRWNYYSRAKIAAEQLVQAAAARGRIATTILRPTWVYGPRDATSLGRLASALRAGRLRWIGDGQNTLSLVYVTDVAEAVWLAASRLEARGQIYNVATVEPGVTQQRFIERLCELLRLPRPTARLSYAAAHRVGFASECVAHLTRYRLCPPITRLSVLLLGGERRYAADKLRAELGWQPAVYFAEGLARAVESYQTHGAPAPS